VKARRLVLLACLCATCWLAGCSPLTIITSDNDGSTVALESSGILIVHLKADPSTGYAWQIQGTLRPEILRSLGDPKIDCDETATVGTPCSVEFQFRAVSVGTTPLDLVYKRSWEDEPIDTFSVTVSIR
jgi:inhibitor of cysteine peptidase